MMKDGRVLFVLSTRDHFSNEWFVRHVIATHTYLAMDRIGPRSEFSNCSSCSLSTLFFSSSTTQHLVTTTMCKYLAHHPGGSVLTFTAGFAGFGNNNSSKRTHEASSQTNNSVIRLRVNTQRGRRALWGRSTSSWIRKLNASWNSRSCSRRSVWWWRRIWRRSIRSSGSYAASDWRSLWAEQPG